MPLDGSAGHGDGTVIKQAHFEQMLGVHLRVTEKIKAKAQYDHIREYVYIDLNAGPGLVNGAEGSPLIFTRLAAELGVKFRAFLFERDPESVARLSAELRSRADAWRDYGQIMIVSGDHTKTVQQVADHLAPLAAPAYGLIYADPNATLLNTAPIRALLANRQLRFMDVFAYIAATPYKRRNGAFKETHAPVSFMADLESLGKRCLWLRQPVGRHQFTIAVLSNWDGFPKFDHIGVHRSTSAAGQEIARRLSLTAEAFERENQLPLPFVPSRLIAPTRTTSDIRGSGRSGRLFSDEPAVYASAAASDRQPNRIT